MIQEVKQPKYVENLTKLVKKRSYQEVNQPHDAEDLLRLFKRRDISIGVGSNDTKIIYPKLEEGMTRSITEDQLMTQEQREKADGLFIERPKNTKEGISPKGFNFSIEMIESFLDVLGKSIRNKKSLY